MSKWLKEQSEKSWLRAEEWMLAHNEEGDTLCSEAGVRKRP